MEVIFWGERWWVRRKPTHHVVAASPCSSEPLVTLADTPFTVSIGRTASQAFVDFVKVLVIKIPVVLVFPATGLNVMPLVPPVSLVPAITSVSVTKSTVN